MEQVSKSNLNLVVGLRYLETALPSKSLCSDPFEDPLDRSESKHHIIKFIQTLENNHLYVKVVFVKSYHSFFPTVVDEKTLSHLLETSCQTKTWGTEKYNQQTTNKLSMLN